MDALSKDIEPSSKPGRSALDAVGQARKRCLEMDWVIDLDIRDFFGSLDHDLLMKALPHRTDLKWIHLYVERWLKAPLQKEDGTLEARNSGTPQGGVISPLLANVYLRYAFDLWAERWRRREATGDRVCVLYADDVVLGFQHESDARRFWGAMRERLQESSLTLHPEKPG